MSAQEDAQRLPSRGQVEQDPRPTEEVATDASRPVLQVIDAHATPEEVAAIVAVFSALGGGAAPAPKPPRSQWAHPGRQMHPALAHGRGGWRNSSLPR